jgi:hypothetical protein
VTGGGASDGDMPIISWPAQGDVPPVGDPALDALLSGDPPPDGAATGLRRAAEVLAALNDAPLTSELAAWPGALAVFRSEIGRPGQPAPARRRRHAWPGSRVSAKLAAAATAAAVTFGGAVAAAYAGVLPASVQQLAHDTLGAPPAHPPAHPAHTVTPAGPRVAGHSGYGLCAAYAHLKAHGSARQKAVAFRNLATAAGGAANVTAYCAAVAHPGETPPGKPASHATGKPARHPAGKPARHPAGKPPGSPRPDPQPSGRGQR